MGYASVYFMSCSWTHCHEAEEVRWYGSLVWFAPFNISCSCVRKTFSVFLLLDTLSLILPNYVPIFY